MKATKKIIPALTIPLVLLAYSYTTHSSAKILNNEFAVGQYLEVPDYTLSPEYKLEVVKSVKRDAPNLLAEYSGEYRWVGPCTIQVDSQEMVIGDQLKFGEKIYCFLWHK